MQWNAWQTAVEGRIGMGGMRDRDLWEVVECLSQIALFVGLDI